MLPYLSQTVKYSQKFYHAVDVVDSGWGDSCVYNLNYLKTYTGPVRVIAMCHGCIIKPFALPIPLLNRHAPVPNGVCNYTTDSTKFSLLNLFDTQDKLFKRIVDLAVYHCKTNHDEAFVAAFFYFHYCSM